MEPKERRWMLRRSSPKSSSRQRLGAGHSPRSANKSSAVSEPRQDGRHAGQGESRPFPSVECERVVHDKNGDGDFDWLNHEIDRNGYSHSLSVMNTNLDRQADSKFE